MTCRTKGPRRELQHPECGRQMGDKWERRYSIQNVGDKWETSGRQMSMTSRTKGPRRALEHP